MLLYLFIYHQADCSPGNCTSNEYCNLEHGRCQRCPDKGSRCPYVPNIAEQQSECKVSCGGKWHGFREDISEYS